ncbi:SDR family NAD(P)-dependent oxidoreductase [Microbacterium sp. NPDC077663]|uniref:SDR family NAD(P)-dependent oxidoreductase n=1 Tax=Microbacterium sp. NPDC077663 TaxID=3364189 RepID=UPI0037C638FD
MQKNGINLQGRRAVVTGGASGMGLATVERFRESGANVVVWDRSKEALRLLAERLGPDGVETYELDVTDRAAVAAAAHAASQGGPVDILVNSAGGPFGHQPVQEYPDDDWDRELALNLTGVFLTCRALIPGMIENSYGRIVNVASIAGKEGNPHQAGYVAAKAGVIALTKTIARELAGAGIIANSITPTTFETPLFHSWAETQEDQITEWVSSRIPLGRLGRAEEAAAMIAWLSSEECSFTTGLPFDLSGGRATY